MLTTTKYCHLLEASVDMTSPGSYDSICTGTIEEKKKAVRDAMAADLELQSIPYYADDPNSAKLIPDNPPIRQHWAEKLLEAGIPELDVAFVVQVLNPNPLERPTAEDIMRSDFLDK